MGKLEGGARVSDPLRTDGRDAQAGGGHSVHGQVEVGRKEEAMVPSLAQDVASRPYRSYDSPALARRPDRRAGSHSSALAANLFRQTNNTSSTPSISIIPGASSSLRWK